MNGYLVAELRNQDLWSRPRQPYEAHECLWHKRPNEKETREAAAKPTWRKRVTENLKAIFPGLT